jgi:4a-hydroxytetrahydrobiopterin dehydratase
MDLTQKKCVPCEGGVPPFTQEKIATYLKEVMGWEVLEGEKVRKHYKFSNFKESWAFINKIGEIAEAEGHHPDIEFGWGYARITLTTHAINGLSENDFIMAAKIDKI